MQFKLAILSALTARPDGRATFDDLKAEVEALTANEDQPEAVASALDDIDIFQSGLVIPEDGGLRITDAGRSALKALEGSSKPSFDLPSASPSHALKTIDDLIGTEERLKIFDLEFRGDEIDFRPEGAEVEDAASRGALPVVVQDAGPDLPPERIAQTNPPETGEADLRSSETATIVPAEPLPPDTPAFLVRGGLSSGIKAPGPSSPRRTRLFKSIAARLQQAHVIWRRHLERDTPNLKAGPRTGNVGGGAIALLSLLVIVICAGALLALTQIRSLKSEVATLQRELSPLKERARVDAGDKAKKDADQQKGFQTKSGVEKNKAGPAPRTDQAALNLSPEEIRLIRDYIKPAPATATPAPAISVGDTVGIATIPLPSQLMEKIPKLLGARFTTRNGSIIILRRDSRQADIVLPPN